MSIKNPQKRAGLEDLPKLNLKYIKFNELLTELNKRDLPEEIISVINNEVTLLDSHQNTDKSYIKLLRKSQNRILSVLEKKLKIVKKLHYRDTWLALGISVFGIPLGVAIGMALGNMAFLGVGIPIGLAIGIGVGTAMDQKAREQGRQLDIDL